MSAPPNDHWEHVYSTKAADAVSWFQPHAHRSLQFIDSLALSTDAAIIDVGGGTSTLVDDLLGRGFTHITVLDISAAALRVAQERLGTHSNDVTWLQTNITTAALPQSHYDLWHDRAVFHFLTLPADRTAYVQIAAQSIKRGGHLLLSTFAQDGPTQCSGLPVMRYDAEALEAIFAPHFRLIAHDRETHQTPFNTAQQFTYALFQRS